MILILIGLALVSLVLAGRHRRRRRPMVWIPVTAEFSVGALTDNAVAKSDLLGGNLTEDFYWAGSKLTWSARGGTSGEGAVEVGLAHGDYTAAEIEENLEVAFLGPLAKIQQEQARRLVRRVGTFPQVSADERLNDGVPVVTASKFVQQDGASPAVWAHNLSGATLTTGLVIIITGHIYGRWIL